jgi:hypothetical protein
VVVLEEVSLQISGALVAVAALPPILRLAAVPVRPVPAPINSPSVRMFPFTSSFCPGVVVPMPTLPEEFHIPLPGKLTFPVNVGLAVGAPPILARAVAGVVTSIVHEEDIVLIGTIVK